VRWHMAALVGVLVLVICPFLVLAARAPVVFCAEGTVGVDDPERIAGVMRACGYEAELCGSWDVGGRLPSDPRTLSRYSVVVLSDVEAWRLSPHHWEALDRYVRSGGGLLLVGGAYGLGAGGWDACPLVSVLPVLVEPGCEWRPVRAAVTGVSHTLARAVPWAECPEFRGMNPVKAKDLGFVVLSDRTSGMPLLAIRPWGRGRVAVFSSDITASGVRSSTAGSIFRCS